MPPVNSLVNLFSYGEGAAEKRREVRGALTDEVGEVRKGTNSKRGLLAKPRGLNFYKHYRSSRKCPVRSVLKIST